MKLASVFRDTDDDGQALIIEVARDLPVSFARKVQRARDEAERAVRVFLNPVAQRGGCAIKPAAFDGELAGHAAPPAELHA